MFSFRSAIAPRVLVVGLALVAASEETGSAEDPVPAEPRSGHIDKMLDRILARLQETDYEVREAAQHELEQAALANESVAKTLEVRMANLSPEGQVRVRGALQSHETKRCGVISVVHKGTLHLLNRSGWEFKSLKVGEFQRSAWSPDHTHLAYNGNCNAVDLLNVRTGEGKRLVLLPLGWEVVELAWSPDGTKLAFGTWSTDDKGCRKVHVWDLAQGTRKQLTAETACESSVRWSPTGRQLAFILADSEKPTSLWCMHPDGSGRRAVASVPDRKRQMQTFAWSPDGKRIAFSVEPGEDQPLGMPSTLFCVGEQVENGPLLVAEDQRSISGPVWSPDGGKIVFTVAERVSPGRRNIGVVDSDGKNFKVLTDRQFECQPVWSPDGKKIAFVSSRDDGRDRSPRGFVPKIDVYLMNADGTEQRRLTHVEAQDYSLPLSWFLPPSGWK